MNLSRRDMLLGTMAVGGSTILASMAGTPANAAPAETKEHEEAKMDQTGKLHIALLQMTSHANDSEANLKKATDHCRWAKERRADIALTPEMWSIGYTPFHGTDPADIQKWQAQAIPRDGVWMNHFRGLARELDMAIAITYLEQWPGAPRNSLTLIDRHGADVLTYAKVHTCDFANFESVTTPGHEFFVKELDTAKGPVAIGTMICFDREFPESARTLMLKGAEVVLTPNACLLDDLRIAQFQVRAHENSVCMAMTNYPAPFMNGRSVAFDVSGAQAAQAGSEDCIQSALFDLASIRQYRRTTIWGNAFRRPHRYHTLVEQVPSEVFKRENALGKPFVAAER